MTSQKGASKKPNVGAFDKTADKTDTGGSPGFKRGPAGYWGSTNKGASSMKTASNEENSALSVPKEPESAAKPASRFSSPFSFQQKAGNKGEKEKGEPGSEYKTPRRGMFQFAFSGGNSVKKPTVSDADRNDPNATKDRNTENLKPENVPSAPSTDGSSEVSESLPRARSKKKKKRAKAGLDDDSASAASEASLQPSKTPEAIPEVTAKVDSYLSERSETSLASSTRSKPHTDLEAAAAAATGPLPQPWIQQLTAVTVHATGPLQPDVHVVAPTVRLHFVDATNGKPLTYKVPDKAQGAPRPLLPLQTFPFALKDRQEAQLAARWDQRLTVEEVEAARVVHKNTMLLVEVLQLPSSFGSFQHGSNAAFASGAYRIAWGFLRLMQDGGARNLGRTRLELYRPLAPSALAAFRLPWSVRPDEQGPEQVFHMWQRTHSLPMDKRPRYNSWLEVTVEVVEHPLLQLQARIPRELPPSRPTLMQRIENERSFGGLASADRVRAGDAAIAARLGRVTVEQMLGVTAMASAAPEEEEAGASEVLNPAATLAPRDSGDECQVPNMLHLTVPTGTTGCSLVAFSPDGTLVATVFADKLRYAVQVHLATTGMLMHNFKGHHDLVYDVEWSQDSTLLTTASSDFTAKVWHVDKTIAAGVARGAQRTLQHACFVYTAAFHPVDARVVATGAYDCTVRLWNVQTGELLSELCVHRACVNTLAFDALGKRLYSGDGDGVLKELSCDVRGAKKREVEDGDGPGLLKLKLLRSANELAGEPIAHVKVHPQGRKVIVLTKCSRLCAVDVKLFAVSHDYPGVKCSLHPLKFDVSPDGRYILSGSEDGRVQLWEFKSTQQHHMHNCEVRSEMVYAVSWSKAHHALALAYNNCALPVAIHKFDSERQPALSKDHKEVTFSALTEREPAAAKRENRLEVPETLTMTNIAEMLASIRASKEKLMARVGPVRQQQQQERLRRSQTAEPEVAATSGDEAPQMTSEDEDDLPAKSAPTLVDSIYKPIVASPAEPAAATESRPWPHGGSSVAMPSTQAKTAEVTPASVPKNADKKKLESMPSLSAQGIPELPTLKVTQLPGSKLSRPGAPSAPAPLDHRPSFGFATTNPPAAPKLAKETPAPAPVKPEELERKAESAVDTPTPLQVPVVEAGVKGVEQASVGESKLAPALAPTEPWKDKPTLKPLPALTTLQPSAPLPSLGSMMAPRAADVAASSESAIEPSVALPTQPTHAPSPLVAPLPTAAPPFEEEEDGIAEEILDETTDMVELQTPMPIAPFASTLADPAVSLNPMPSPPLSAKEPTLPASPKPAAEQQSEVWSSPLESMDLDDLPKTPKVPSSLKPMRPPSSEPAVAASQTAPALIPAPPQPAPVLTPKPPPPRREPETAVRAFEAADTVEHTFAALPPPAADPPEEVAPEASKAAAAAALVPEPPAQRKAGASPRQPSAMGGFGLDKSFTDKQDALPFTPGAEVTTKPKMLEPTASVVSLATAAPTGDPPASSARDGAASTRSVQPTETPNTSKVVTPFEVKAPQADMEVEDLIEELA